MKYAGLLNQNVQLWILDSNSYQDLLFVFFFFMFYHF